MTNHIHLIASAKEGYNLSGIIRDFKKYTSRQLLEAIDDSSESRRSWMLWIFKSAGQQNTNNTYFQLWQQDNRPIELTTNDMLEQRLEYLHNNPVKEGIVAKPEDYLYSSATDYCGRKGLIDVVLIE